MIKMMPMTLRKPTGKEMLKIGFILLVIGTFIMALPVIIEWILLILSLHIAEQVFMVGLIIIVVGAVMVIVFMNS